jgi:hypothetical protein
MLFAEWGTCDYDCTTLGWVSGLRMAAQLRSLQQGQSRFYVVRAPITVTVAAALTLLVTAELPWVLLEMVVICATAECKALLVPRGGGDDWLVGALHKALEHAASKLQQTAAGNRYVSMQSLLDACPVECRNAACLAAELPGRA